MRRVTLIIIICLLLAGCAENKEAPTSTATTDNTPKEGTAKVPTMGISRTDYAEHDNKDSCWIVYGKNVYDATALLEDHPDLLKQCGKNTFADAYDAAAADELLGETTRIDLYEG